MRRKTIPGIIAATDPLVMLTAYDYWTALMGISFLYATTGTIYFDAMAEVLTISNLSVLGFILFFSGLAFKISLAPFHFWTADVYQGAPISIASFLSVISKGAAVMILMIILFTVMKPLIPVWSKIIYMVAIATMFVGNLFALRQNNMKRFLAYSSIAQAGFILLQGETQTLANLIHIAGVDDPAGRYQGRPGSDSEYQVLSTLSTDLFTLLLKHQPIVDKNSTRHFDLQLSGHTHNGQIFPFSLLTRLFYKTHPGLTQLQDGSFAYVSRGSGTWGPPVRFLSPPEVTLIEILRAQ